MFQQLFLTNVETGLTEVLSDEDKITSSRPRDYPMKYPNLFLLNEQGNGLG